MKQDKGHPMKNEVNDHALLRDLEPSVVCEPCSGENAAQCYNKCDCTAVVFYCAACRDFFAEEQQQGIAMRCATCLDFMPDPIAWLPL
jgi:hypothetical protein